MSLSQLKPCVCLECGGQLEYWEEFVLESRWKVSNKGKLLKKKVNSTGDSLGTHGLTCLKCGKEYNGNDLKNDAEYELFQRVYEKRGKGKMKKYYLCDYCKDTDEPDDEEIFTCKTCKSQICSACVVNLKVGEMIPCDEQHNIAAKYCPFCTGKVKENE